MGALSPNFWLVAIGVFTVLSLLGLFITRTPAEWEDPVGLIEDMANPVGVEDEEEYLARARAQDPFEFDAVADGWSTDPDCDRHDT